MARFVQLLKKSGVYSNQNFMIVPSNGFNLVALLDAKDFRLEHDARLDVKEVRMDDVDRIANEYVATRATGPEKADLGLRLRTAMYGTVPFSTRSSKVLKVSAKGAGIPIVKARRDNVEVRMDAAILRRKEFTVAFRFVKHNNGSTKFNTTDADTWINKLNWIFGAQANIYFKLLNATWVTIPKALGSPMT
jgi:hypothetical protein